MTEEDRVLAIELDPSDNDAKASSVREYLVALLAKLWDEGEGFNGKRPFGNSGWEHELIGPVEDAGIVGPENAIYNAIWRLADFD